LSPPKGGLSFSAFLGNPSSGANPTLIKTAALPIWRLRHSDLQFGRLEVHDGTRTLAGFSPNPQDVLAILKKDSDQ